jgi:hypothetical protein
MRDITDILAVLHYDSKWFEYGFIDQHTLLEQFARFESGVDDLPEHHRYLSFSRLLDEGVIDDLVIQRFIELALLDEDKTMAQAALGQLVRHGGLTPHQFSDLKTHPAFASRELQNIIEQTELLRELHSSVLSDDLSIAV